MIEQILYGIVAGTGYAIAGWQKKSLNEPHKTTKFDWIQLGKSVLVCGVIVGGISGYSGQDFNILITGTLGIGATKVVDLVWKLGKQIFGNVIKK